jgi:hypothetical protein
MVSPVDCLKVEKAAELVTRAAFVYFRLPTKAAVFVR